MDDNVSIRRELGKGVWLLVSGMVIKASCVTKDLAEKMLSKSAIDRGAEDGDNLTYPAENGRASIPLFELSQKGYLDLNGSEIREHFSRLVRLVPDYLSERGLLPAKKTLLVVEKIATDYKNYIKAFSFLRKKDIIENAAEIAARQKIVDFFKKNDAQNMGAGMLPVEKNLLERVREHLGDVDVFSFNDSIKTAVETISKDALADDYAVKRALSPFQRELEVAKNSGIKSVDCTLLMEGARSIKMNPTDFYNHLDPAVLERFAQHEMRDFPCKDCFGKAGEKIYDKLLQKRFCADLVKNYNSYSTVAENGWYLAINKTSKVAVKADGLKELQDRAALREYAESCYKSPDAVISRIDKFFAEQSEFIGKVKEAAVPSPSAQKYGVDIAVEEKSEGKVVTFTNSEGKKAVFDERFDSEMRSNYALPKDIDECLTSLGVTAAALSEIKIDKAFEGVITPQSLMATIDGELDKLQGSSGIGSGALKNYGISVQIDSFDKGNVYIFTATDGKRSTFDERFSDDMRSYYGMPKDIKECLSAVGLTALVAEELSKEEIFAPITANKNSAKAIIPTAKIAPEVPFPEAENEPTPLPFPETEKENPKASEKVSPLPQNNILNNILSQVQETRQTGEVSRGR